MNIKLRLTLLNFLEFAVWGAYLTSMGTYLAGVGLGSHIGWFYSVQGIVSIFMPALMGILADRWMEGQRVLSLCHTLAGAFMIAASCYGYQAGPNPDFGTLFSLYAALPPTWRVKSEADAKRHFHLFMKMLGANLQVEDASAFGYADAIVETKKAVYVFEFKFNKSAKAAIRQIREKGYADAYKADKRPVTLIGINFSAKKRNIDEPIIEPL